ncbi:MAG: SprT-like domain-containing protein [Bacteroidetes bacterium]|nr:SprT-like domain-containing protein [Bacteroidota bacterium]MBS1972814.1 SprT-like domain-containing protein [Bacteroidota bacterium]
MPKKEAPLEYLNHFIPEGASQLVMDYLHQYKVHLTVTRERKTVLGDYRNAVDGKNHRISVNGNLNKYAFLITLIHELAHLITFMHYGNKVKSHGKEWKFIYAKMLEDFLKLNIFPQDIIVAFRQTIHDLPASSCADEGLTRVLRNYDEPSEGLMLIEQVNEGDFFETEDNRVFRKGKRLRKRFECIEIATKRVYLFSPLYEVRAAKAG